MKYSIFELYVLYYYIISVQVSDPVIREMRIRIRFADVFKLKRNPLKETRRV